MKETSPLPSYRKRGKTVPPSVRRQLGWERKTKTLAKLPRSFYLHPTLTVAKNLLGKYLVRKHRHMLVVGKIVEVEAYLGENDPASHAYRGRTKRNDVMFWEGGHLYVYFTYGMHFCCNVVTEGEGKGRAVLLRAVEPIEGIEVMVRNRLGKRASGKIGEGEMWGEDLTNGPAKVCEAFGITRKHNGVDLCGNEIWIGEPSNPKSLPCRQAGAIRIQQSTRVGIRNGREKKWRFYVKGSGFVSRI